MEYTFILIKKDGTYLGWSKAQEEPPNGDPDNMEWITWGKELPPDVDTLRDENGNSLYTIDMLREYRGDTI